MDEIVVNFNVFSPCKKDKAKNKENDTHIVTQFDRMVDNECEDKECVKITSERA